MDTFCRQWIVGILQNHLPLVSLAVRQRAKFEGWLKFELARRAESEGMDRVRVESTYGNGRSDVSFDYDGVRYDLELKTPNTNYRIHGVDVLTRPITDNIASIVRDAQKLQGCPGRGIVAFVLFPLPQGSNVWRSYLERIVSELGITLSEETHCARVNVPLQDGYSCDAVVCCFSYPAFV